MTFFKTLTSLIIISLLLVGNSISDSHDNEQNIIEKAKEINKKVKKEQALQSAEEPLPLNDPFVGDAFMPAKIIFIFLVFIISIISLKLFSV